MRLQAFTVLRSGSDEVRLVVEGAYVNERCVITMSAQEAAQLGQALFCPERAKEIRWERAGAEKPGGGR